VTGYDLIMRTPSEKATLFGLYFWPALRIETQLEAYRNLTLRFARAIRRGDIEAARELVGGSRDGHERYLNDAFVAAAGTGRVGQSTLWSSTN